MSVQLELKAIKRAWLDDAAWQIDALLPKLGRFSTDDIHPLLPKPEHENWYGILMAQLKNKGLIRRVDATASKRPEANGRLISVWEATT
jgi:hypothetical protein